MASAVFIVLLILVAIFAPLIVKHPRASRPERAEHQRCPTRSEAPTGPSAAHPFGVDQLGEDMLSRVIYGARVSLEVGIIGTAHRDARRRPWSGCSPVSTGGWVDTRCSRMVDVFLSFPVLLLGLGIARGVRASTAAWAALIQPGVATVIFDHRAR